MTRLTALRVIVWVVPAALAYAVVLTRARTRSLTAALVMGFMWNGWTLLAINAIAVHVGWWSFEPGVAELMGVAVEPWLGWTILWTILPVAAARGPVALTVVAVAWLDLIAMPALEPLVVLGDNWLLGEAVSLGGAFVPGLMLVRWTLGGRHLTARLVLQIACAAALFLWVVPSVALESSGGWASVLELPSWFATSILQILALAAIVGVRAAIEFADKGRGTPLPYDPPVVMVTSGPYAYVRNPMQLSMVLVFLIAGLAFGNPLLVGAALVAFAYGAGLAEWHEDAQLTRRFGALWTRYRASVRPWVPRLRPAIDDEATLLVAYSCGTCSSVGRWFLARYPVGLKIAPAEDVPDPGLRRVTYVSAGGSTKRGVVAIARALEHINLGWAVVGWVLAMPGVSHFAQLLVDVFGPAPQNVAGRPYDAAACAVDHADGARTRSQRDSGPPHQKTPA